MISVPDEPLLSLSEAARAIPPIDGKRPHPSTLFRWMTEGVRGGVKLEFVRVGRRICTTEKALNRFFKALADAPMPQSEPVLPRARTANQRTRAIEEAKQELRAAGAL